MCIVARSCPCWLTGTLLLASIVLFPASRVKASCGDYLLTGTSGPMVAHSATRELPRFPAPKPCHGPNCSKLPRAPVIPNAPVVVSITDHIDCGMLRNEQVIDLQLSFDLALPISVRAMDRHADVFHPPRFQSV